jgi:hypothetical protein
MQPQSDNPQDSQTQIDSPNTVQQSTGGDEQGSTRDLLTEYQGQLEVNSPAGLGDQSGLTVAKSDPIMLILWYCVAVIAIVGVFIRVLNKNRAVMSAETPTPPPKPAEPAKSAKSTKRKTSTKKKSTKKKAKSKKK